MSELKELRERADLSQRAIAELLGVTVASVSRWENGKRRIAAEIAVQIDRVTDGRIPKESLRPDLFVTSPAPADQFFRA